MPGLTVRESQGRIRLARGGRLMPWLGPALRGLTGGRLRARACRWPVVDQIGRWECCLGCPRMAGCGYGETFEPDPPAGLVLAAGWENVARPIVFAPTFPVPDPGRAGDEFDLRILAIGHTSAGHLDAVWEALRVAGADLAIGLGEDHIPFDVARIDSATFDIELLLPIVPTPGDVAAVRVELTSPLFLTETDAGGRKRPLTGPTFGQLVRAGLRTLGPLHRLYGLPLPDGVFAAVKAAGANVPMIGSRFEEFRQGRFSNRTKDRYEMVGVIGHVEYGPVPSWLVPWLEWAGRLHVGTHRVAGAGGWRMLAGDESRANWGLASAGR